MADIGALFGGDFMDSYLKGFQLSQMKQRQDQEMQIRQQNLEMNKMFKEEQVLNLRQKRTAIDEAQRLQEKMRGDLQPTTIPEQNLSAWSEPDEIAGPSQQTNLTIPSSLGPSKIESQFGPQVATALQYAPNPGAVLLEALKERMKGDSLHNVPAGTTVINAQGQPVYTAPKEQTWQDPLGKLQADRETAVKMYGEGHPLVAAIDKKIAGEGAPKNQQPYVNPEGRTVLVDTSSPNAQGIIDSLRLRPLQEKTAEIKVQGFGNIREFPVLDTKNGNSPMFLNANDVNAANKAEPGRYIPAGVGVPALNKTSLIEDIRGNIQATRDSIKSLKTDFTPTQRAAIAYVLKSPDIRASATPFLQGSVAASMSPEQVDYVTNIFQLVENGMAMRSVLGAGQGSDELRAAIKATLPGAATPNKAWADTQLNKFESVLNRLSRGVPTVPLRSMPGQPGATAAPTHKYIPGKGIVAVGGP